MPFSQIIPPSPSPSRLFSNSFAHLALTALGTNTGHPNLLLQVGNRKFPCSPTHFLYKVSHIPITLNCALLYIPFSLIHLRKCLTLMINSV